MRTWAFLTPDILIFFVLLKESGMRALPTTECPNKEGVIPKCTRVQEAVGYHYPLETDASNLIRLSWACFQDPIGIQRICAFL